VNAVKVRNITIGEGMPKICVPIVGKTKEEILAAAQETLEVPADLVEWRADWFESVFEIEKVKKLLAQLRDMLNDKPLLFTFRTKAEGGEKEISFEQYRKLLQDVAGIGHADMIDVETFWEGHASDMGDFIKGLQRSGVKVVGSNHDFVKTPDKAEILRRLCYMQEIGVDIPKIAVMPQIPNDVLTLLDATSEMRNRYANRPIITMSMGTLGAVSRISGEIFGSSVTFGTVTQASAPGQIEAKQLKNVMEILHPTQ